MAVPMGVGNDYLRNRRPASTSVYDTGNGMMSSPLSNDNRGQSSHYQRSDERTTRTARSTTNNRDGSRMFGPGNPGPWTSPSISKIVEEHRQLVEARSWTALISMLLHLLGVVLTAWVTLDPPQAMVDSLRGLLPNPTATVSLTAWVLLLFFFASFVADVYKQLRYRIFFQENGITEKQRQMLGLSGAVTTMHAPATAPTNSTSKILTQNAASPLRTDAQTSPRVASRYMRPADIVPGGNNRARAALTSTPRTGSMNNQMSSELMSPRSPHARPSPMSPHTPLNRSIVNYNDSIYNGGSPLGQMNSSMLSSHKSPASTGRVSDPRGTRDLLQRWLTEKNSKPAYISSPTTSETMHDTESFHQRSFYSPASKVPQKMETRANREGNTTVPPAQVWERLPDLANRLDESTDACRLWLSQRVLRHVVDLVQKANKELELNSRVHAAGEKHVLFGEDSLSAIQYRSVQIRNSQMQQLQQMGRQMGPQSAVGENIAKVIRYLSIHENQKYLVSRIAVLADDSCLSDYQHNGGENGKHKGAPKWTAECPSDAQILVHCFCCYMDEHAYSQISTGDPLDSLNFTRLHFVKEPESLSGLSKRAATTDTYIYQSSIRPPHFQIAIELDNGTFEIWDLKPGRKNLFHAIVVFMYYTCQGSHTKLDEYAHTSLGQSGLNIARMFHFTGC